ncbi:VOC family protein [Paracoccus suum]|uniref:Bleomycin resistance protein n=1 Tax=Paracoccus suum TaxID=2259340 RepID=A0A344PHA9_9RHOB|nr:VOC family protein [Paracoccus suum]AXC48764.1 VOC family protein [Paracoccus suum]
MTPELGIRDLKRSLDFWVGIIGFAVRYTRPEEGFAMLGLGPARLMLASINLGRTFDAARVRAEGAPLGLGMNLEIEVTDLDALVGRATRSGLTPLLPLETRWYRTGTGVVGQRQLVLADPDGYLARPFTEVTASA